MSDIYARIEALATEAAAAEMCQLVEVEITSEGGLRILRVFVEKMDGSVLLDQCAAVSTRLSGLLDVQDILAGEYQLEVSSPGLTRPLKKREDFIRFQGRLAAIQTYAALPQVELVPEPKKSGKQKASPGATRKIFKGVLQGVEEDDLLIRIQGTVSRIPLRSISKAHLDFEF
ncbi:MAG: ribosome maturation factor [Magnetococcales bacterium]|nr:ribosome maturation factor [Magnetococcales bacterium]